MRLTKADALDANGKAHSFCIAARTMRTALADHARRRNAGKRGGGRERITLQGVLADESTHGHELLDLQEAMTRLEAVDPRQAEVAARLRDASLSVVDRQAALRALRRLVLQP